MKFEARVQAILEGSDIKGLDKLIKKLSDESLYDDTYDMLRADFDKNGDKPNWNPEEAVDDILDTMNSKYPLPKKDLKLLKDILNSEAYNMLSRG